MDDLKNEILKLFKFVTIFLLSIIVNYAILFLYIDKFHIHYLISSFISFTVTFVFNCLLVFLFIFKIKKKKINKDRYNIVLFLAFIGLIIYELVFFILIKKIGLYYMTSNAINIIILAIYNVTICKKVIIKNISLKELKRKITNIIKNINKLWENFINKKYIKTIFKFLPHNVFVFILLLVSIITIIKFNTFSVSDYNYLYIQNNNASNIGSIMKKTKINLDFIESTDKFSYLCFKVGTYERKTNIDLTLLVKNNNKTIYKGTKNLKNINDGDFLCYYSKKMNLKTIKDNNVYLIPSSNVNKKNAVTIFKDSNTGNISVVLANKQNSNLNDVKNIIIIISILVYLLINYLINTRKIQIHSFYKYSFIYVIMLLFIIPPYQIPDEPVHFLTSYKMSQIQLKKNSNDDTLVVPKNIDCINYSHLNSDDKISNLNDIYKCSKSTKNISNYKSSVNIKSIFGYIPQSIGIKIADIISNSPLFIFYFGRLFACFISFIIILFAIKITPKYKNLFLVVATMMMFVQQMASYSYDSVLNAVSLLFVAYVLKLIYKEEKINLKDFIFLTLLIVIINNIKNYAYLPLLSLILFIPNEKYPNGKKIYKYIYIIVILLISFVTLYLCNNYIDYLTKKINVNSAPPFPGVMPQKQLNYIIHHPFQVIEIIYNTIKVCGKFYLNGLVGYFAWFLFKVSDIYIFVYLLLFGYIIVCEKSDIDIKAKIINILSILVSIAFICFGMYLYWTNYKYYHIEGVQGRYFIPLLLPFLISIIPRRKKEIVINNNIIYGCINILLLQMVLTFTLWYF